MRDRRGEHERGNLVARQVDLGHLETLEIDHVAAVFERIVLVWSDVANRHAEIEEVGFVALEGAQPGLDVERLIRRELFANLAIRHRRTRAQQDHHEIEQALAAITARGRVVRPVIRSLFQLRLSLRGLVRARGGWRCLPLGGLCGPHQGVLAHFARRSEVTLAAE
jgi:hypothetical protein